jgi:hypothetical protein
MQPKRNAKTSQPGGLVDYPAVIVDSRRQSCHDPAALFRLSPVRVVELNGGGPRITGECSHRHSNYGTPR